MDIGDREVFAGATGGVLVGLALSIMAFSIYGLSTGNFTLFGAGAAMGVALFVGYLFVGDQMFESPFDSEWNALSAIGFFFAGTLASSGSTFSVYSTSTEGYLSVLSGADLGVRAIIDTWFAPYVENIVILGQIVAVYYVLTSVRPGSRVLHFVPEPVMDMVYFGVAVASGGILFAALHAGRDIGFFIRAFTVMAVMAVLVVGQDLGFVDVEVVATGILSMFYFHAGINVGEYGGVLEVLRIYMSADFPVSVIVWMIILTNLFVLYLAARGLFWRFYDYF